MVPEILLFTFNDTDRFIIVYFCEMINAGGEKNQINFMIPGNARRRRGKDGNPIRSRSFLIDILGYLNSQLLHSVAQFRA